MSELSPEARAIIDAGRDGDAAGDLERARVRRALFATIAAGGGAAVAGSTAVAAQTAAAPVAAATTTTGAVAATATLPLAKLLVPLALLAAGSVGGTIAWHARGVELTTAPTTEHVATRAPLAPPAPMDVPVLAPIAPTRAVAHRPVVHAAVPAHQGPLATNRLGEETALLSSANAALRAGEASRALALLDDYDRRYPGGVLREEMLATRIIARCELDAGGAVAGAEAFLARHPRSPLATRVRSSCSR